MAARDDGLDTLVEALLQQGFSAADEFGFSLTHQRADPAIPADHLPWAHYAEYP